MTYFDSPEALNMAFRIPCIGEWFIDKGNGQLFEIVAIDEQSSTIEIQFVDGELGEYETEVWGTQTIEPAAAPEDWSAAYEVAAEDRNTDTFALPPDNPLNTIEPDVTLGVDELY